MDLSHFCYLAFILTLLHLWRSIAQYYISDYSMQNIILHIIGN